MPTSAPSPRPFRWSWRLGSPFGIGVYVHATFLILVAWIVIGQLAAGRGAAGALASLALLAAIFTIVVLHELGHALAALRFGIPTRAITLLPIGGVASLERMPDRPGQELLVALAGPAVNVALAALLGAVLVARGEPLAAGSLAVFELDPVRGLFWVNVIMAGFNLLPAFPMDGGRALRAVLAMRLEPVRATELAARIGKATALAFAIVGAIAAPLLIVIALFVWLGAEGEVQAARLRAALADVPVAHAMVLRAPALAPDRPLREAAALIVGDGARAIPVVEDGAVRGVVTHADVIRAVAAAGPDAPVATALRGPAATIAAGAPLAQALAALGRGDAAMLVVGDDGRPIGVISLASIDDFLALRPAFERGLRRAAGAP